ncbi:hypothetical protein G4G28_07780 [Massilia sp. Dwa41.01b]|nr:hypothetical protein G4G28_07780 [Massilia sp. Dwa41.01b]QNB01390.1 hypothetical protein G4G31_11465 [Massilia sp. Se16.2.3]
MKERGILFSGAMVRALLDGTKSQTRRALRPQPEGECAPEMARNRFGLAGDRLWVRETYFAFGHWETRPKAGKAGNARYFIDQTRTSGQRYRYALDEPGGADPLAGRVAGDLPRWHQRPALFMPRAASRILLEIVGVRVERLRAISADDALAEGIDPQGAGGDPVLAYRKVWERINGAGSWDADPWVWAVELRRLAP